MLPNGDNGSIAIVGAITRIAHDAMHWSH